MKNKKNQSWDKMNIIIFILIILGVIFLFFRNTSLIIDNLFEKEKVNYEFYFHDSFDGYSENSEVLNNDSEDLSRWEKAGVITAWTNVEDWNNIDRIDLKLTDSSGQEFILTGIENVKSPRENNMIKSDDEFPDYYLNCQQKLNKWEDYMIVNGKNFLFWEYNDSPNINISNVVSWKAYNNDSEIEIYDVVIHDGLCKDKNSLNGSWYSPNGLPMYGVWWTEDGNLIMKNVEQEQYPSNGDHTRILSDKNTPKNFILRTRFKIVNLKDGSWLGSLFKSQKSNVNDNTYIRLAWDFDNEYDPGHDQTMVYYSFEYNYLGLQRVFPVERYFVQGYEPHQSNKEAKTRLSLKENRTYEIQLKVEDKKVEVEVYEIGRFYSKRLARINYEFENERPDKSYPISIESTGNVEMILEDIEVWKLQE